MPVLLSIRQRVSVAACRRGLIYQGDSRTSLIVSALIVLPQIIVAVIAPWVGRQAKNWGRRPLLLVGLGALPIRALLFMLITDPPLLLLIQLLDGISGAVIGVLTALVVADLTTGTGRFNLSQGLVGTASGIGASLSTALFGLIAASFGRMVVFRQGADRTVSRRPRGAADRAVPRRAAAAQSG